MFIGNIVNSIVHEILERAIDNEEISNKYERELLTSFEIAKRYRAKINPVNEPLNERESKTIRLKIIKKVRSELLIRISRGYMGIDLDLVEKLVDKALKNMKVV